MIKQRMANRGILGLILVFCGSFLLIPFQGSSQEQVITAGFQFKPIFSSKFFNMEAKTAKNRGVSFEIKPSSGYCMGMVIRKGFTNRISFETGINYVKRNYNLAITDSASTRESGFSIIGYEIPALGLVFIQLSDHIFMDVALGISLDFYPSDIRTTDDYFEHYSARDSWFSPAILGNLGWEYRTEKSGYFYLGASYHRPFSDTFYSFVVYPESKLPKAESRLNLQGNYLTLDLRYFFHSDPAKRKKKIKK